MELKVTNQNYCATVIKLPQKQPVAGLDKLVKVTVFGNDCLVSTDEPEDDLYIFFPAETQIVPGLLKRSSLFRNVLLNKDQTKKGFFEDSGRVKALKFKGIISTGFIAPVSFIGEDYLELNVGDEFNQIDGIDICWKYQRKYNQTQGVGGDKPSKINNKMVDLLVKNQFRFHDETSQLAKNLHMLNYDDIIVITDKWHGSSCILSKVLIKKKLNWKEKLINIFGGKISEEKYGYVYSSGKPKSNLPKGIEGEWINKGQDYYTNNIWKDAFEEYKHALEDGISIYGELVGYTGNSGYIQKGYDYGCVLGQMKFVVYRITYTKPDGNKIEFSWQQIKDYCTKYGMETVKELKFGKLRHIMQNIPFRAEETIDDHRQQFLEVLQSTLERTCPHCTTGVPSEGIVVRIDGKEHFNAYKLKSKKFLKHETDELDKGTVDVEEEANNA